MRLCWRAAFLPFLSFYFLDIGYSKPHIGLAAGRKKRGRFDYHVNQVDAKLHHLLDGTWKA